MMQIVHLNKTSDTPQGYLALYEAWSSCRSGYKTGLGRQLQHDDSSLGEGVWKLPHTCAVGNKGHCMEV
jgi:hypothetical protein